MRLFKHICTDHDYFPGNLYKSKQLRRRYFVLLYTYQLTSANIVEVNIITNTLCLLPWSVCCLLLSFEAKTNNCFEYLPPPLVWFCVNFPFSIHFRYYYHLMLFPEPATIPSAIQHNTLKCTHISAWRAFTLRTIDKRACSSSLYIYTGTAKPNETKPNSVPVLHICSKCKYSSFQSICSMFGWEAIVSCTKRLYTLACEGKIGAINVHRTCDCKAQSRIS